MYLLVLACFKTNWLLCVNKSKWTKKCTFMLLSVLSDRRYISGMHDCSLQYGWRTSARL